MIKEVKFIASDNMVNSLFRRSTTLSFSYLRFFGVRHGLSLLACYSDASTYFSPFLLCELLVSFKPRFWYNSPDLQRNLRSFNSAGQWFSDLAATRFLGSTFMVELEPCTVSSWGSLHLGRCLMYRAKVCCFKLSLWDWTSRHKTISVVLAWLQWILLCNLVLISSRCSLVPLFSGTFHASLPHT